MRKFLLLSIVLASVVLPILAAREPNSLRALKKALLLMLGFSMFYLLAIRFLYSRLN